MTTAHATPAAHSRRPTPAARVLAVLTIGALLLMPLPDGANRPWALHAFSLWFAAVAALAAIACLGKRVVVRLDRLQLTALCIWLLWLGWIALQLLPLPAPLLHLLSPAAYDAYARLAVASHQAPSFMAPISVDPVGTRATLSASAAYFCIFLLVLLCVRDPRSRAWLVSGVIAGAVLQSLWGVGMVISGLEIGPFGRKLHYLGSATGTYVNRNHFAGYLELGAALTAGAILAGFAAGPRASDWRGVVRQVIDALLGASPARRVALLVLVLGLVASRSRMGNIAFFTVFTVGALVYVMRKERNALRSVVFVSVVLMVDLLVASSYVGLDQLLARLHPGMIAADQRVATFADLTHMIHDYFGVGSGLGSFAVTYPLYRSPEVFAFVDHAHNDFAQFLIEAGLPGSLLLGTLLCLVAMRTLRVLNRRQDPTVLGQALGGALALGCIGLHSLTDFNLQIPANAATVVAILAMLLGFSDRSSRRRSGV